MFLTTECEISRAAVVARLNRRTPSALASAPVFGLAALAMAGFTAPVNAHDTHDHSKGVQAERGNVERAPFDIIHAKVDTQGNVATFHMAVSGKAGESKPAASGKLAGAQVFSYVWPTTINTATVGFDDDAGILAMAVTSHPDFDDTPLFDENADGRTDNDGNLWHSHWVVLVSDDACGAGNLKVKDIPEGSKPRLPKTWPGLPIHIDSPGWDPVFHDEIVEVHVPFDDIAKVDGISFDGVTSALRVNANIHAPLLCVVDVFDVASGDLSLPGKINE
jgi:hypothetical protein